MMGGNIQKKKMVDERGDNTAVFFAYKMHRRQIRRRLGNKFQGTKPIILANRSPLTKSEKERNNTMIRYYQSEIACFIPVLTMHMSRTHIPIAKGTAATLGKFGSAMGM